MGTAVVQSQADYLVSVLTQSLAVARRRLYGDDAAADALLSALDPRIKSATYALSEQLTAYGMALAALAATLNRREARKIVAALLREAFPQRFATPAANGSQQPGSASGAPTAPAASPPPPAVSPAQSRAVSRKKK